MSAVRHGFTVLMVRLFASRAHEKIRRYVYTENCWMVQKVKLLREEKARFVLTMYCL